MSSTLFERHPLKTLFGAGFALLLLMAVFSEIALRFIVPYNIGYYTAVKKEGVYNYPYGQIVFNSMGYPDEEFDLDSPKKRIGYFGDSVTYGVGAGYGYRFADLLQARYPQYEHWVYGLLGNGIQGPFLVDQAKTLRLDTAIYVMNLNDILPDLHAQSRGKTSTNPHKKNLQAIIFQLRASFYSSIDRLRGKSYLYTTLRMAFKNILIKHGYGHTGFKAAELFPHQNDALIATVTTRIQETAVALKKEGIRFCVLIVPYEMQISDDAAKTYAALGVTWEDGFTDGSTQALVKKGLAGLPVYDALNAFAGLKKTATVGEYFVYNQGDKIDFNHPNRAGHALIADGFETSKSCPVF